MNKQEKLLKVLWNKAMRISYLEHDFHNFFLYYFNKHIKFRKLAPYQKVWIKDWEQWFNLYIEWHREAAKTTIMWLAFEIWKIAYNKSDFICNLCYDKQKAKAFNKMIVMELLQNKLLREDFWLLFTLKKTDLEDDDIWERWITEFITTNYVKVKAFWMWEAIRWEVYNHKIKWNVRPDHLNVDDIDNIKNTKNKRIIEEDMDFLKSEVFGWMDNHKGQVIRLWNIIRKDWRNPRIKKEMKDNKKWKVHSNFIYWVAWTLEWQIQWERYVEKEKETGKSKYWPTISLEALKMKEWSWYKQNYIWLPIIKWEQIVKEEWIIYNSDLKEFDYYTIWIDPAFSLKTWSDAFWIVVTWFKQIKDTLYKKVVYCKKLENEKKDTLIAINIIKSLYYKYWVTRIFIENNNWGWTLWRLLVNEWLAVEIVNAVKDKVTRLKEREWELMRGQIYFSPDVSELVDELLDFTWEDWWEDNLVDAFVHSLNEAVAEFWMS